MPTRQHAGAAVGGAREHLNAPLIHRQFIGGIVEVGAGEHGRLWPAGTRVGICGVWVKVPGARVRAGSHGALTSRLFSPGASISPQHRRVCRSRAPMRRRAWRESVRPVWRCASRATIGHAVKSIVVADPHEGERVPPSESRGDAPIG